MILITPKQEVERKNEWFCGVKFFPSNFKVERENGVWTKIRILARGFLFTYGNFTLRFTVFWIGFFFQMVFFFNPIIVHSRPSFLVWTKLPFLVSGHFSFLFTCGILTLIFWFFYFLFFRFFRIGFPNALLFRPRSSFSFSQWKFVELFFRTCPAMFFKICSHLLKTFEVKL